MTVRLQSSREDVLALEVKGLTINLSSMITWHRLTSEVLISRIQLSQALALPLILRLIEKGEFVPTFESPYFRSIAGISVASRDVTNC